MTTAFFKIVENVISYKSRVIFKQQTCFPFNKQTGFFKYKINIPLNLIGC